MECWHCGRPAQAVCVFCGRGVCKQHTKELPSIMAMYDSKDNTKKAIVVPDGIYCGVCHPKEDPVEMKGLD